MPELPITQRKTRSETIATGRFHCDGDGAFEVCIEFMHRDPHFPLELRLFLDTGAIYGSLADFGVGLISSGEILPMPAGMGS